MKEIRKLTALFALNVILALMGTPQNAKAGEDPEVCAECMTWYAHVCGGSGDFAHTFDHDPPSCDPQHPVEEGVSYGDYDADHATVYQGTCDDLHTTCDGGQHD